MRTHGAGTLVILAAFLAGCGGGESRWAGTISDSGGVTIVSNTDVGVWMPGEEWTLEQELRIGALQGAPEYQFGEVGSIAIDSKGRVFVLDSQAQHIQVYSPEGVYEQTIGGRGSGPGEFRAGMALLMGPGDTLLVPDVWNRRFSRYAPDGSSAGSIRINIDDGYPMLFKTATTGAIAEQIRPFALLSGQPTIENPMDVLVLLASDGAVTDTLMTFPSGKEVTGSGYHHYAAEPVWDLIDYSQIVLGVNDEYRLGIYADGRLERIITKSFEREPVGDRDIAAIWGEFDRRWAAQNVPANVRQQLWDNMDFAEFLPAILTVAAGSMGTIWVQHWRPYSEFSVEELASVREGHYEDLGAPEWDVFDAEGRFLGVVTMPGRFAPSLFRGDKIYGVWHDEFNVGYVVRLRIVGDLGAGAT